MTITPDKLVACNFCGRDQNDVSVLVTADDGTAICDACTRQCMAIVEEDAARQAAPPVPEPTRRRTGTKTGTKAPK